MINANSDVQAFRTGVGSYMLVLPQVTSGRFLMTTITPTAFSPATPVRTPLFARVTSDSRSATSPKTTTLLIEIYNLSGALVDSDFEFISLERSGS